MGDEGGEIRLGNLLEERQIMEEIYNNLSNIEEWINSSPEPTSFRDNNDFMNFVVQLMNCSLYLLRLCIALAPTEEISDRGYTKHKAIIVGHMVRIAKLYEGLLIHISSRQLELANVFIRLIFETSIRMEYMMTSQVPKNTYRIFILTSYKL